MKGGGEKDLTRLLTWVDPLTPSLLLKWVLTSLYWGLTWAGGYWVVGCWVLFSKGYSLGLV